MWYSKLDYYKFFVKSSNEAGEKKVPRLCFAINIKPLHGTSIMSFPRDDIMNKYITIECVNVLYKVVFVRRNRGSFGIPSNISSYVHPFRITSQISRDWNGSPHAK